MKHPNEIEVKSITVFYLEDKKYDEFVQHLRQFEFKRRERFMIERIAASLDGVVYTQKFNILKSYRRRMRKSYVSLYVSYAGAVPTIVDSITPHAKQ